MFGHPQVWMPSYILDVPICLDTPCMFGYPLFVWVPLCFDAPCMFGHPLYIWMMFGYIHNTKKACFVRLRGYPYMPIHFNSPIFLDPPVCLNASICLDTPLYVWMSLVCLDVPICLDTTHMFGCPPSCLDAPICVATILHFCHFVFVILNILSIFFQNIPLSFEFCTICTLKLWET